MAAEKCRKCVRRSPVCPSCNNKPRRSILGQFCKSNRGSTSPVPWRRASSDACPKAPSCLHTEAETGGSRWSGFPGVRGHEKVPGRRCPLGPSHPMGDVQVGDLAIGRLTQRG